ncbi:MAG: ComEC/Rec2 family competence protein [Crocinitomicaceae bacterium]|jgi:competence protein ComEC
MGNSFGNNLRFLEFTPVFQKQPFLYLFIFQAFGVVVGNSILSFEILFSSFGISILAFLVYLNFNNLLKKWSFLIGLASLFFFLGYLTIYLFCSHSFQLEEFEKSANFKMKVIEFQPKKDGWSKGIGEVTLLDSKKKKNERIVFYCQSNSVFDVNDYLLVQSDLIPIENKGNPGEFNMELFWKTKGIRTMSFIDENSFKLLDRFERNFFQEFIYSLQTSFNEMLESHLEGENLAVAKAIILGDKSMLDSETKNSFSATGAMHVLAVSGLHIGLILQILMEVAKFFSRFISRKKAILSILVLLWIYSILTGFSPSVIRSIFMFTILVLAQFFGKEQNNINSLFFSAFVLLLFQPMFLFDIGFQLSYLAMVGIYTLYRPIESLYQPKNKIIRYFWQGTAVGFAAQCMTVPLTLYYFHQFPNYFAIANLGLMVVSGLVLGLGIALFALHYIPLIGKLTGFLLMISIAGMLWFIQWVEHLPGAVAYGFNLPFILVPIISFLTFFLVKITSNRLIWKLTAVAFSISLILTIYFRWNSLNDSHICILNQNKLSLIVKNKNQLICLYNDDYQNLEKIKFTAESYLKCFPGKIQYYSFKDKNVDLEISKHKLNLKKVNSDFVLKIDNQRIRFIHSEKSTSKKPDKTYFMPWIENSKSLNKGAIILPLNS